MTDLNEKAHQIVALVDKFMIANERYIKAKPSERMPGDYDNIKWYKASLNNLLTEYYALKKLELLEKARGNRND